jgi:hypothetical protein
VKTALICIFLEVAELNNIDPPVNKSIDYLATWAKFKLIEKENSSYTVAMNDSIITDTWFIYIGHNAGDKSCRFIADTRSENNPENIKTAPCQAILATTALQHGKDTYFIILYQGNSNIIEGIIYVNRDQGMSEAIDLEHTFVDEIKSKQILKVKAALKKRLDGR